MTGGRGCTNGDCADGVECRHGGLSVGEADCAEFGKARQAEGSSRSFRLTMVLRKPHRLGEDQGEVPTGMAQTV